MFIEMCLNEKYKHLTFKFDKKIIEMQNRYFVWAFWSLFYIFIYGLATVFFFSNAIFKWKYSEFWRPALLFLHGIYIGAFTAGNSFGIVAYSYRMEVFLIPEVNKIWLIIHRAILFFTVVFMMCMTFYGDYNFYSTNVIDGSLVVFLHFPPFYQGMWLALSLVWIISIVFLCWEFNSRLRKVYDKYINTLIRTKYIYIYIYNMRRINIEYSVIINIKYVYSIYSTLCII